VDLATVDELLTTTRSVRRRLDLSRPVPRAVVEECLTLALQAPTGGASEDWRWILIDDAEGRERIADLYRDGAHLLASSKARAKTAQSARAYADAEFLAANLHRVPVLILPCVRGRLRDGDTLRAASLFGSVLPAAWSLMLALRSRGLAAAWTTLHLNREREVADHLGIPGEYLQAALIPVAYPIGGPSFRAARRRPVSEVSCWGRWSLPAP